MTEGEGGAVARGARSSSWRGLAGPHMYTAVWPGIVGEGGSGVVSDLAISKGRGGSGAV